MAVLALPVLIGVGAILSSQAALTQLQATNARLQLENDSFRAATGELAAQISSLQSAVDEIGAQAVVDPDVDRAMSRLPPRVRERAMGGAPGALAAPVLSGAFGSPDNAFGVLRDILGLIEQQLASVRTGVDRRQALAAATPSIWPITGWISSGFGNRRDPFTGGGRFPSGPGHLRDSGAACPRPRRWDGHDRRLQRQLRQPDPGRSRVRDRDPLRSPFTLQRRRRPAGPPRTGHRLCRFHGPFNQPPPPLRSPRQRTSDQSAQASVALKERLRWRRCAAPQLPIQNSSCLVQWGDHHLTVFSPDAGQHNPGESHRHAERA